MFLTWAAFLLLAPVPDLFARDNLIAWCIVPFDSQKRTPEARAEMLHRLGFKKYAYDWRAEHLPTFERELIALKKHKIELTAVWFPAGLDKDGQFLLDMLGKHGIKTQLWVMLGDPAPGKPDADKVKAAVDRLTPLTDAAGKIGCRVSIYNHGGWAGEPENMVAIVKAAGKSNLGIAYNMHHGHDHLDRFADALKRMTPHLDCLNLNGMVKAGDRNNKKILPLGTGDRELDLMKIIRKSSYTGPIGILGHTNDDAEERLRDNLDGFDWLVPQVDGKPAGTRPVPRTPHGNGLVIRRGQDGTNGPLTFVISGFTEAERLSLKHDPQDYPSERLSRAFPVYAINDIPTDESKLARLPATLGTYAVKGETILFTSRFPPTPGITYRAIFDRNIAFAGPDMQQPRVQADFTVAKIERTPTTIVEQVFPAVDLLPENVLRLYIQFSSPMSGGDVYRHLKLLDEKGHVIKAPFLELEQELWSADKTRFTLLFDPGRIKHGLVPREELGAVLEAGKKYTLVVDSRWHDENGTPLKAEFRKTFRAGPADDSAINFEQWKIEPPSSSGALKVVFGKTLDQALARRMIWVVGPDGQRLTGKVELSEKSDLWSFRLSSGNWKPGEYRLVADTRLEDPCGNRIGTPFEVRGETPDEMKTVERKFIVK